MQWLLRQQVNGEGHGWYPVHALVELVYIIWYRLLNHADYVLATCYLLWHIVNYWFSLSCIGFTPCITCNISSLLSTGYIGVVTHLWGECHIQNFPSMENTTSIWLSGWWSCYSTPPFCIGFFPFLGMWEWAHYKSSVIYNLVRLFLSTNHHGQWKWIPCLCWQAPRCTLPSTQEMTVSKSLWSVIDSLAHHMTQSSGQDPLIHYSWHFSQTVHAMCSIHTVITKGLIHAAKISELQLDPEEALDDE